VLLTYCSALAWRWPEYVCVCEREAAAAGSAAAAAAAAADSGSAGWRFLSVLFDVSTPSGLRFLVCLSNFQLVADNDGVLLKMKNEVQLPVQLAMAGTNVHSQISKNQMPGHVAIL
jgi:hypothetical protein